MKVLTAALVAILCLSAVRPLRAADDSVVSPFVDPNTDVVVSVDFTGIDFDAVEKWQINLINGAGVDKKSADGMIAQAQQGLLPAREWSAQFTKAGGHRIYVVGSVGAMLFGQPGVIVAPLEGNADGSAIAKIFDSNFDPAAPATAPAQAGGTEPIASIIGKNVVYGAPAVVERLRKATPAQVPPALIEALTAGGDAPVRLAVKPSVLRALKMMMPGMPVATTQAAQSVDWGTLSLKTPPNISLSVLVQCKDATAAASLADSINGGVNQLRASPKVKAALGDAEPLAKALTPAVTGNRVAVTLDTDTINNVLGPALLKASQRKLQQAPTSAPAPGQPGL